MKEFVRTILDYPVKGIQFRDITSLLQNSKHFSKVIDQMTEPWKEEKIDAIFSRNHLRHFRDTHNPKHVCCELD